jgi:hypothetical protein
MILSHPNKKNESLRKKGHYEGVQSGHGEYPRKVDGENRH